MRPFSRKTLLGWAVASAASPAAAFAGATSSSLVEAPTLLSPTDGGTVPSRTPTLSWAPIDTASGYRYQLTDHTDTEFVKIKIDAVVTTTTVILPTLTDRATYRWRVAGIDASGTGPMSASWTFKVTAVTLVTCRHGCLVTVTSVDYSKLDRWTSLMGTPPRVLHFGHSWKSNTGVYVDLQSSVLDKLVGRGIEPMYSWMPHRSGAGMPNESEFSNAATLSGRHDGYIAKFAGQVRDWQARTGRKLRIRMFHEHNGDWYPYSDGVNGNKTGSYVAAWRHVYFLFKRTCPTAVLMPCWTRRNWGPYTWANGFPGLDAVDEIGLDGYNKVYDKHTGSASIAWSPATVFDDALGNLTQLAPGKPIGIYEVGCADYRERPGYKAQWISDLFAYFRTKPAVAWFCYYSRNDGTAKELQFDIETATPTGSAVAAYKTAIQDPYFQ